MGGMREPLQPLQPLQLTWSFGGRSRGTITGRRALIALRVLERLAHHLAYLDQVNAGALRIPFHAARETGQFTVKVYVEDTSDPGGAEAA